MTKPLLIGIAGGTGSGKTSVTRAIVEALPPDTVAVLEHDSYYKDQSHLSFAQRLQTNYDHPLALRHPLLIEHLQQLLQRQAHSQAGLFLYGTYPPPETVLVPNRPVIILEGILILEDERIRNLLDIKGLRRYRRRCAHHSPHHPGHPGAGQDAGIGGQPITWRWCAPCTCSLSNPPKRYADIIIPEGAHNTVAIDILVAKIRKHSAVR